MSMSNPESLDGNVAGALSDRAQLEKFFDAFLRWDRGGLASDFKEAVHNAATHLGKPLPPALASFVSDPND